MCTVWALEYALGDKEKHDKEKHDKGKSGSSSALAQFRLGSSQSIS